MDDDGDGAGIALMSSEELAAANVPLPAAESGKAASPVTKAAPDVLVRDLGLALEMMLQDVTTGDDDALDDASDSEDTGGADTQETEQAKDETEDAAALPASDTAEEAPQTKQSDEEDEEGGSMKSHSEEDTSHADVLTSAITSKLEAMGLMDEQMLEERRTFEAGSAAGSSAAGVAKGGDVISVQCSVEDGEDLVPFLTRFLASKGYAPGCVSHAAFNAIKGKLGAVMGHAENPPSVDPPGLASTINSSCDIMAAHGVARTDSTSSLTQWVSRTLVQRRADAVGRASAPLSKSEVAECIHDVVYQYEGRCGAFKARRNSFGSPGVWDEKGMRRRSSLPSTSFADSPPDSAANASGAGAAGAASPGGDGGEEEEDAFSEPYEVAVAFLSDLLLPDSKKKLQLAAAPPREAALGHSGHAVLPPPEVPLLGLHRQAAVTLLTLLLELVPDIVGPIYIHFKVFNRVLDLFFQHPFCNCLHANVLEMCVKSCPSMSTASTPSTFFRRSQAAFVHPVQYRLRDHLFNDCQLVPRVFQAHGANKVHVLQTNNRLPFMGHLRVMAHYMNAARTESALIEDEMTMHCELWEEVCQDCADMDALEALPLGGKSAPKSQALAVLRFSTDAVAQGKGVQPSGAAGAAPATGNRQRADSATGYAGPSNPSGWMNSFMGLARMNRSPRSSR